MDITTQFHQDCQQARQEIQAILDRLENKYPGYGVGLARKAGQPLDLDCKPLGHMGYATKGGVTRPLATKKQ